MSFRLSGRKRTRRQAGLRGVIRAPKRITVIRAAAQPRALTFIPRSLGTPRAVTEHKYFDEERAATAVTVGTADWAGAEADPATVNTLFAPTTGNDFNNRVGRKVDVKRIMIRGQIQAAPQVNQTAADTAGRVRIILVQDMQTNTAQLNAEDVINSGDATQAISMFQNPAFFGRFRVLKDKEYVIQNPSITYDGTNIEQSGLIRKIKMTKKFFKAVRVSFNATNGGTVADIVDNSFHVIALTNNGDLAITLGYKVRTMFVDP